MIYIWLNLPAILTGTAIALILGALYRRAMPFDAATMGVGAILAAALAMFWLTAILAGALILAPPKAAAWTMALGSAIVIWAGFVMPVLVATGAARGTPAPTITADAGYWLVAMLAAAVAMSAIGLSAPPA
jgi:hypothetical protein